ncbi:hypothetical protein SARC_14522, partial [Sphaeroforma arctica JP610]
EAYFAKVVDALMTDESELTKPKFYTTMKLPTEGTEPAPMVGKPPSLDPRSKSQMHVLGVNLKTIV